MLNESELRVERGKKENSSNRFCFCQATLIAIELFDKQDWDLINSSNLWINFPQVVLHWQFDSVEVVEEGDS